MNKDLRRRLDRIAGILRDGVVANPAEQISHLILLKLLDEQEDSRATRNGVGQGRDAGLFPLQARRFRWSEWRARRGEDLQRFLGDEVFYYVASLSREAPEAAWHFRGSALGIDDPGVLERLVDELDAIDFSRLDVGVRGDVFEYLLGRLVVAAKRDGAEEGGSGRGVAGSRGGLYRTPPHVRALMVRMAHPDLGDAIFDPACGTGGLLVDAVDYIRTRYSDAPEEVPIYGEDWLEQRDQTVEEAKRELPGLQTRRLGAGERLPTRGQVDATVHGADVLPGLIRLAQVNLLLHGVSTPKLRAGNALSSQGAFGEADLERRYDVAISNPPMGARFPRRPIRRDLPAAARSEILFVALLMQSLAPGGRCAVLVPDAMLTGAAKAHRELRETLLRRFAVQAVVSLPLAALLPEAKIRTSVLVFRRPTVEPRDADPATRHVWFCEVRNDGFHPQRIENGVRRTAPEENEIPALLKDWADYEARGFETPPGAEAGSVLEAGAEAPRSWWAPFEMVAEAGYDLASSRYRPFLDEPIPEEEPAELIREILDLEREIAAGLELLLDDLERSP